MLLAEFGTGQVFWSLLWFALFFLWIWLLINIFGDIIRSQDLSGWGKALWALFVIVLPYLGVFVYLVTRGHKMHERDLQDVRDRDATFRSYVERTASTGGGAEEVARLAQLRDAGVLTEDEFQQAKAKALT